MTSIDAGLLRVPARWRTAVARSGAVFLRDVGHGLLEVSHNTLALLGLLVVGVVLFAVGPRRPAPRVEAQTLSWLQARHEARVQATADPAAEPDLGEPDAVAARHRRRPQGPDRQQAVGRAVAVAPLPRRARAGQPAGPGSLDRRRAANLDPTLILAIMAVESSFNPFAQSPVGAQGLMQVMTKVHDDKYEAFGGSHAAFDPVTNLRVGVQVLKECIARAGSLEAGLRLYVGAANSATTAATPARCWPSRASCAWWPAAATCRTTAAVPPPAAKARPAADAATPAPTPSRKRRRRPSPRRRAEQIASALTSPRPRARSRRAPLRYTAAPRDWRCGSPTGSPRWITTGKRGRRLRRCVVGRAVRLGSPASRRISMLARDLP